MLRWRTKVAQGLAGDVVEIGFGSGLNLSVMGPEVRTVYAVEPSATAMKLAAKRIREAPMDVVHVGLDGGAIELSDASCDAAICTFTLCTVPDPRRALGEGTERTRSAPAQAYRSHHRPRAAAGLARRSRGGHR